MNEPIFHNYLNALVILKATVVPMETRVVKYLIKIYYILI
jgi:hypothetical protein